MTAAGRFLPAAAFLAPIALRALSYADRILDRDEAYWLAAAMRMRDFDLPMYVSGWDMKPPGAFALHRAALALSPSSPLLAAHLLGAVSAGLACALVALAARRLGGLVAGFAAAAVFALLDSTGPVRALAANTEVVAYVPVACLVYVLAAGRPRGARLPLACGALAALAALAKQPALVYAPAAWVALVLSPHPRPSAWRCLFLGVAGAAAVLGAACGWLLLSGGWDDFVACNLSITRDRAGVGLARAAVETSYARWWAVLRANPVAAVGVAGLLVAAALRRDRARETLRVLGPLVLAGAAAALAGGFGFQHYLQLAYAPVAAAAGVGVASMVEAAPAGRRRWATGLLLLAVAGVAAGVDRLGQWRSRDWRGYEGPAVRAVRARIHAVSQPSDSMFVWGMHPDLYVTVRRAPASRFTSAGWLVGTYTGGPPPEGVEPTEFVPGSWDLLFADLDASRPAVIVDSAPTNVHGFGPYPIERFPRLAAFLAERYVRDAEPAGGYVVWRRKD